MAKLDKLSILEVVVSVMEDEIDTLHEKVKALEIRMGIQEVLAQREDEEWAVKIWNVYWTRYLQKYLGVSGDG